MTDRSQPRVAPLARWSARLALFSASLMPLGMLLHRFTSFSTPVALNLFAVALAGAVLAVLLGLLAFAQIWRRGHGGALAAATGILVPVLAWAWPLTYLPAYLTLPPISDVSTDLANPPRFVALAKQRPRDANPPAHPGESAGKKQQQAYPDLRTFTIDRPVEETFEVVEEVVHKLKWKVAAVDPPAARPAKTGTLEATDRTLLVGFQDDIVVRVEGGLNQSRVDVRSASRYGVADFGQNAARTRHFLKELYARLETTPGVTGRRRPLSAALKRLKERDQQKAGSRSERGPARSDARHGRAQKETQR